MLDTERPPSLTDAARDCLRRSVVWNLMAGVIKAQIRAVKDENGEKVESIAIGPYGQLYLDRKALEAGRVESAIHAHNRAARWVSKRIIRDLTVAWTREVGHCAGETHPGIADLAPLPVAAE